MREVQVFYRAAAPGRPPRILDVVEVTSAGKVGRVTGESLESLQSRYGNEVAIGDLYAIDASIANHHRLPPREIPEVEYFKSVEHANVCDRNRDRSGTTWKDGRRIYGCVTAIFAVVGDRYFTLHDNVGLTHEEILSRVQRQMTTPS